LQVVQDGVARQPVNLGPMKKAVAAAGRVRDFNAAG
jgi:hypothetical protein